MASHKYIPAIDGLRAVAILIVFSSHVVSAKIPGGFGVTLFFFISGFLITGLLIDEQSSNGFIDIKRFYVRRFMRLAPALLTMIAIVSAVYAFAFGATSAREIAAAVFYLMNYYSILQGDVPIPLGPLWSLSVEEHFYLVFPLLVTALWRFRERMFFGLVGICAAVLVWRVVLVISGAPEIRTYFATDTRIDSILFGSLLALAMRLRWRLDCLAGKPAIACGIALLAVSVALRQPFFRETFRYTLQGIAIAPLFFFVLTRESAIRRILESRPAVWIGNISYSLYLWHFPVLALVDRQKIDHPTISLAIVTGLTFGIAWASFHFVETPLRQRGRTTPRRSPVLSSS